MKDARLVTIAETGDLLSDFWPYVPALDGSARVAFTATLAFGGMKRPASVGILRLG